MTLTHAQQKANRRNARASTGPRTPEGKARSAANATKHGLLAETVLLPEEDTEGFAAFRTGWETELAPAGPVEMHLAEQIVVDAWRARRFPAVEAALMAHLRRNPLAPQEGYAGAFLHAAGHDGHAMLRLARYEHELHSRLLRNLDALARLQAAWREGASSGPEDP